MSEKDPSEGGYILVLSEWSTKAINEFLESQKYITRAFKESELEVDLMYGACLLSCDGVRIDYAAMIQKVRKVTTTDYSMKFSDFVGLYHLDLNFSDIEKECGFVLLNLDATTRYLASHLWSRVITAIKTLRPTIANTLSQLEERIREYHRIPRTNPGFEVMAQEKDAVNTALWIAGIDRVQELPSRVMTTRDPAPFISVIAGVKQLEDRAIEFDASLISKEWEPIFRSSRGYVTFKNQAGAQVSVVNVNRSPIESTLGVDLMYYHEDFRSLVLVQYKMLEETGNQGEGYRPRGKSYERELARMQDFMVKFPDTQETVERDDYRLHASPFYFKLCLPAQYEPKTAEPIPGMYLPLDYWEVLLKSPGVKGPRDGFWFTEETVGRYFNTSEFVTLMQSGWIGTRGNISEKIVSIVENIVESETNNGDSVILALGHGSPQSKRKMPRSMSQRDPSKPRRK